MHSFRFRLRKLSVWVAVFVQLLVITYYFSIKKDQVVPVQDTVTFIRFKNFTWTTNVTYHTKYSSIALKRVPTRLGYTDFNTSLCYTNGTDVKEMRRSNDVNWKCLCLPGWHGTDCGQPEVIWRGLLAYRKALSIKGPRKHARRVIYVCETNEYTEILTEIRVNELDDVVDLYVLYEINSNYLEKRLNTKRFLKKQLNKILYLNINDKNNLWKIIKKLITNIDEDDIILTSGINEIPNKLGIGYFKFYNDWPEPINFRLKYSVYGFFWTHPSKTIVTGGASTVRYLNEVLNDDLIYLNSNKTLSNLSNKNFIIGDLNHYGGWFCEYCTDPLLIINYLKAKVNDTISWDKVHVIDNNYIENLIENGVYIDGKTNLNRAHRNRENYFAPEFAIENSWKFDFLLVNMFSKIDYYE
nr:beta-1,4-mannosyl-glycoprotein 4-beta-N-acetylglucosaminyltransferase [Onthophagus taurus]